MEASAIVVHKGSDNLTTAHCIPMNPRPTQFILKTYASISTAADNLLQRVGRRIIRIMRPASVASSC